VIQVLSWEEGERIVASILATKLRKGYTLKKGKSALG
jgi:hypothetical protein